MPFLGAPSRGNEVQQETAAHESEYLSYTGVRIHPRCFKNIEASSAYSHAEEKISFGGSCRPGSGRSHSVIKAQAFGRDSERGRGPQRAPVLRSLGWE